MSRIEQIESQIRELGPDELTALRSCFSQFDAEVWDQTIETDARNGKLLSLAEQALQDHKSGKSTSL